MAWTVSAELEDALWTAAGRCLPAGALAGRALTRAIVDRSLRYTSERARLHEPGGDQAADLAARALFFTVADAAKVMIPLAELDRAGLFAGRDPLRILDLGAGAGAMTLGALDYLHRAGLLTGRAVTIRAVDRDARALDIMRLAVAALAERWRAPMELSPAATPEVSPEGMPEVIIDRADLARGPLPGVARADLVLCGALLNELDPARSRALVTFMLAAAGERGAVVIVEPALRDLARRLHELRDWVLEHRLARVLAPCTRQIAPCPALLDESDWCHEDRPTALPARAARLAAATGLRAHGLKFAYLVLGHAREAQVQPGDTALRVVSRPRKSKGKRECHVCSDAGRVRLRLLRRDLGPENAAFERARRGDVLVTRAELGQGGDVHPDDRVVVVSVEPPGSE